jgi:hypothetical protein
MVTMNDFKMPASMANFVMAIKLTAKYNFTRPTCCCFTMKNKSTQVEKIADVRPVQIRKYGVPISRITKHISITYSYITG